jgi:hypothetical protein
LGAKSKSGKIETFPSISEKLSAEIRTERKMNRGKRGAGFIRQRRLHGLQTLAVEGSVTIPWRE